MLSRLLGAAATVVMWLLLSLLFSIIVEWVGVTVWWPDQGTDHSRGMLAQELACLVRDFRTTVITSDPVGFAERIAERSHYLLFEVTGLEKLMHWASRVSDWPYTGATRRSPNS